jgi:hypothetical protein
MRALLCAALRALLNGGRRRFVVRVASPLLTLGSTSLWNGHCLLVGILGAAAGAEVQVRTARQTQSLAVGTAQYERRSFEEPLFTQSRTQIDFHSAAPAAQWKNVGIFAAFFYRFGVGKDEIGVGANIGPDLHQATPALPQRGTSELATEVVPPRPSRREPPGDVDVLDGTHIAFQPDLIVAVQTAFNLDRRDRKRLCWKRHHSSELYPMHPRRATLLVSVT